MGKWNQVLISGSTIHAAGITASAIPDRNNANDKVLVIDTTTGCISRTGSFGGGGGGTGDGFPFTGSAAISGTLSVEGQAGHITASGNISSSGGDVTAQTGSFNFVSVADKIIHTGDTDTNIAFSSDKIQFTVGETGSLRIQETGGDSSVLVNPEGGFNSRFEVRKASSTTMALVVDGNTGGITASNDMSSSGTIQANIHRAVSTFNLGATGLPVISQSSGKFVFGQAQTVSYPVGVTRVTGSNIEMGAPVTASVISASAAGTNLIGTASHAESSSHALLSAIALIATTANTATNAGGLTGNPTIAVSAITNDSLVASTKITGSFTGSFTGDGSGLSGVSAGFPFTGSAAISGTLAVEGPASSILARSITGSIGITGSFEGEFTGSSHITAPSILESTVEFGDIASVATSKIYGDVVKYGTTDGSLVAGKIYMLHPDGKWKQTNAEAEISSSGMLGVALTTDIADGLLVRGMCDLIVASSTPTGSVLYLSTTIGRAISTPDSGSGDVVRAIGYYLGAQLGVSYFNPDATYITAL